MAQITGKGTTFGFGTTTTWTPKYISIGGLSPSRQDLKTSHLATADGYDTFKPGDLVDGGEITLEGFWEPENGLPPITAAAETMTATYPDSGAATIAFSGYVKSFTIGDADGPTGLAVSGQSSNTTLVPTANIVFGGSGANRTVTVTPAANQAGSTTITVTVTDGTASAETSFVLTVTKRHTFVAVSNLPPEATKAGSTSPMKWRYEDGAGRLVDSSAVQYAVTVVGPCPTTSVSDPCTGGAVRTITNTDPGGSGFRYVNGVWGFNLQTRDHDGTPYLVGFYQLTIRPVTPGFDASPTYPLVIK